MRFASATIIVSMLFPNVAYSQETREKEIVTNSPLLPMDTLEILPILSLRNLPVKDLIVQTGDEFTLNKLAVASSALATQADDRVQMSDLKRLTKEQIGGKGIYIYSFLDERDKGDLATFAAASKEGWETSLQKQVDMTANDVKLVGKWDNNKTYYGLGKEYEYVSDSQKHNLLKAWFAKDDSLAALPAVYVPIKNNATVPIDAKGVGKIIAVNELLTHYNSYGNVNSECKKGTCTFIATALDREFATNIIAAYEPIIAMSKDADDSSKLKATKKSVQLASSDWNTATAVLIKQGQAGIGRPLAFTAAEKRLTVEKSILAQYDVYWVQFAISPDEDIVDKISELRFDIDIQTPEATVLSLLPIRLGTDVSVKEEAKTPTVKVGDVEVGEMFSRSVEYKYLRPTILGHGTLTPNLGWIFKDDALDASAKRMFAVIGVPRGSRSIEIKYSLSVKYSGVAVVFGAIPWGSTGYSIYKIPLFTGK